MAVGAKRSAFWRLGERIAARRKMILIGWLLVMLVAGPFAAKITDRLSQGGFAVPGSQSDAVQRAIEEQFPRRFELTNLVVFHSRSLTATDAAYRAQVQAVRDALTGAPGVGEVGDPYAAPQRFISADGRTVTSVVGLTDDQDQALKNAPILNERVAGANTNESVDVWLAGAAPFYKQFQETTSHDLESAERIALPISLVILVVAFGSLVAAGMPLILSLIGLGLTFGVISIIASLTTMNIFAQNIASMIGIGVGIDYSLFILTRFRTELRARGDTAQALAAAMATSGKAVLVSALTVVVALAGTALVNIAAFRSMGIAAMISVAAAGAGALTLLPAVLASLGPRIEKLRVRRTREREGAGMWHALAQVVMKRAWVALIVCAVVLSVLAWPGRNIRLGSSGAQILPADAPVRIATEQVAEAFGAGQIAPAQVLLRTDEDVTAGAFAIVYDVAAEIAKDPEVARVDSIATVVPGVPQEVARGALADPKVQAFTQTIVSTDKRATLLAVVTKHDPQSDEAGEAVKRLRAALPKVLPAGASVLVGGDPGLNVDLNEELGSKIPLVVGLVMFLSFLVLMVFFRSVLLPLKAIVMNTASVLATYGVLVFIFQEGHFADLLGFTAQNHIESFLPLFLFCILFGLSMDYEVFLLARIREEYLRTHDNTEAVGWGLEHTAGIITSAAAIMITVFGAFAFASLVPIKAMGFGLATAVLLDATLIRVILVPAAMRLMGDWNWWLPGWLDRLLPKVSIESDAPETPEPAAVSA